MKIFKNTLEWLETAKPTKPATLEDKIKIVKQIATWVQEEFQEMEEAVENLDIEEIYDALADVLTFAGNIPYFLTLDLDYLDEYAEKVNLSNFSKYCKTQEQAEITCKLYSSGYHPDKMGEKIDTYFVREGELYVVKKTLDNKIMKSFLYKKPNQF